MADYQFARSGRNRATALTLAVSWGLIGAAWLWLNAAPVLMAVLVLATLPALWDLISARRAGVAVTQTHISWFAGRHSETLALKDIDVARFDTRLDFSVRVRLLTNTGQKLRLPPEAAGPPNALMAALKARGVDVDRRHFALLG